MTNYYNEFDPAAAAWLRELIAKGHIAPGIVDERSIEDVHPSDLRGFTQCHFFAGIGVWSYALRRAGWPDDRPVWTGSCPCQPFSAAGKGTAFADERHLWPAFYHLIKERRPAAVLGEQVASKDADPWIDLVHTDLEALGYAVGAVPFPSAGVGAPHIRDRLYWLGYADEPGLEGQRRGHQTKGRRIRAAGPASQAGESLRLADTDAGGWAEGRARAEPGISDSDSASVRLADADSQRHAGVGLLLRAEESGRGAGDLLEAAGSGQAVGMADADGLAGGQGSEIDGGRHPGSDAQSRPGSGGGLVLGGPGPVNGFWSSADWLACRDGKWRPVEPGTFPLAHGAPARVGRLRGYGNAINAEAARIFIQSVMECLG